MRRRGRKYKTGLGFVAAAMLVLFAIISYKRIDLNAKRDQLLEEKQRYEQMYQKLTEEKEDIESYKDYVNSDEYIEHVAREKLGLVYPNDIVFEADEK